MPQTIGQPGKREARLQTRVGVVRSDKCAKTIKVETERLVAVPKYGKYIRRRTLVHAHDEKGQARVGDTVEVISCRPISRTKTWRLLRILSRGSSQPAAGEGA